MLIKSMFTTLSLISFHQNVFLYPLIPHPNPHSPLIITKLFVFKCILIGESNTDIPPPSPFSPSRTLSPPSQAFIILLSVSTGYVYRHINCLINLFTPTYSCILRFTKKLRGSYKYPIHVHPASTHEQPHMFFSWKQLTKTTSFNQHLH